MGVDKKGNLEVSYMNQLSPHGKIDFKGYLYHILIALF